MGSALPIELLEKIILAILPSTIDVALPASDIATKTLFSLTLTCKSTTSIASDLLLNRCLYIDSPERLVLVLRPLHLRGGREPSSHTYGHSRGLFLAPFSRDTIDEPHIVADIDELFGLLASSLKSLVIDIPLRSLYLEDDVHQVRTVLRSAFLRLASLREFCSIRDELYLETSIDGNQPAVWASWPQLQRLALYNPDVTHEGFLRGLSQCASISHVVLARADGLVDDLTPAQWLNLPQSLKRLTSIHDINLQPPAPPSWKLTFIGRVCQHLSGRESGIEGGFDQFVETEGFQMIGVMTPANNLYEGTSRVVQNFVREYAISRSLWAF